MIFIEKIMILTLITHLQRLLLLENYNWEDDLIMTFYSNIETIIQVDIMKNFQNRKMKILICMDVVGIGVKILNIIYVI